MDKRTPRLPDALDISNVEPLPSTENYSRFIRHIYKLVQSLENTSNPDDQYRLLGYVDAQIGVFCKFPDFYPTNAGSLMIAKYLYEVIVKHQLDQLACHYQHIDRFLATVAIEVISLENDQKTKPPSTPKRLLDILRAVAFSVVPGDHGAPR